MCPSTATPTSLLPQHLFFTLRTPYLFSTTNSLSFQKFLSEWNHTVYHLWGLVLSFSTLSQRCNRAGVNIKSVLLLVAEEYSTTWMGHTVFTRWRASGLFPIWVLLQIKLLKTFRYKGLYEPTFSLLWDKCPRAQWLDYVLYTRLIWQETARQFSGWLRRFTFGPAMDSVAPKPGQHMGLLTAMIDGQWDLTVPWACMCFFTICIHSLWWNGFCPVSNWIVSFVTIKFREHVTYHRYESFVRDTVYKYFLPICCLSFSWGLLKSSLQNFCWGPICQFFLLPIKLLVSRSCAGP